MAFRENVQLFVLSVTAALCVARGDISTDLCTIDSTVPAGAFDFTSLIIRESHNNLDALLNATCNIFLDLEKVAQGEELKLFLMMFNEKLNVCSNQKTFKDHVVILKNGKSSFGDVTNQQNRQFCKAILSARDGVPNGCSGGLLILLLQENISNIEVGKLTRKWIAKMKEIVHNDELKSIFQLFNDIMKLQRRSTTDTVRSANFTWLRLILEEFETNLEAVLFSCDALQELETILQRKKLKEPVHFINDKMKNTCERSIKLRYRPRTKCVLNTLFTALLEIINSAEYIDENGSMFVFLEQEAQEIVYNPDFRKFICKKKGELKKIVQGKELKDLLDHSDSTLCHPNIDRILTSISREPESNWPTLLRFSCETLAGFEERVHGEELIHIIQAFNHKIAKICNNQEEIGRKGLGAVIVFAYYEFFAETIARHGGKSDALEIANEITNEFSTLFMKELSTNTGLVYYLFCERNEIFQSIVHVPEIKQVIKEMNKCNNVSTLHSELSNIEEHYYDNNHTINLTPLETLSQEIKSLKAELGSLKSSEREIITMIKAFGTRFSNLETRLAKAERCQEQLSSIETRLDHLEMEANAKEQ